jgi:hypothetical protein
MRTMPECPTVHPEKVPNMVYLHEMKEKYLKMSQVAGWGISRESGGLSIMDPIGNLRLFPTTVIGQATWDFIKAHTSWPHVDEAVEVKEVNSAYKYQRHLSEKRRLKIIYLEKTIDFLQKRVSELEDELGIEDPEQS